MNRELIEANVRHNHFVTEGIGAGTMMPHLLMDIVLSEFTKNVAVLPLDYTKPAKWRKVWRTEYNEFNKRFCEAFTEEQMGMVTDAMDELEGLVEDDVEALRNALGKCMASVADGERAALISCTMCHMLTETAQVFWRLDCRQDSIQRSNVHLTKISDAILQLIRCLYKGGCNVSVNKSEEVDEICNTLCQKVVHWSMIEA